MGMGQLRRHYEDRFAKNDPYDLGRPESVLAIRRGFAGVDLEGRLTRDWQVECGLDVGCGDWGVFQQLPDLIGTRLSVAGDIALGAVRKARQRSPSPAVQFVVLDAQRLPFRADVFGFVHCVEVLEHLPDADAALAEIKRVGTGRIVLSVPNEQLVGKMTAEHLQTFGYVTFLGALRRAGLRIRRVSGTYLFSRHLSDRRLLRMPGGKLVFCLLLKLGERFPRQSLRIVAVCESGCEGEDE